jgi:hypothetical protein
VKIRHLLAFLRYGTPRELDEREGGPALDNLLARWGGGEVCRQLYTTVVVHPDLGLGPCCSASRLEDDFGSLRDRSYREIRNNPTYRAARGIFRRRRIEGDALQTMCAGCRVAREYVEVSRRS